ncbi:dihydrolipoyllysine-residue acetyltransferase [Methyloligella sp. 2.7D]|uniref:dihydrolipoyllysine-residue acetyltransferase n=1 Tax=unclassified Methyloligella TaxID=2625955 RepID=UPI00157CF074|nr:dihydrolipoyllysine-residue acetyltransferase [Methyloligella sp. GL2]QKP76894.1 dihydrolipoyllysine-residue acetyltransferase [Methyloligella sp. GL2]
MIEVKVPDIGNFADVPVIEVLVSPGDTIAADDPLIALESDKATMEVPAPSGGKVAELLVKVGDTVSEGSLILTLEAAAEVEGGAGPDSQREPGNADEAAPVHSDAASAEQAASSPAASPAPPSAPSSEPDTIAPIPGEVHASPSVRRLARELEIDLSKLQGTGEKGRITKEDVKRSLAGASAAAPGTGGGIPKIPPQDFAQFGPIEEVPLSRLKRLSGPHLHRAWLNVPHVTHTDEADITELDAYRKELDAKAREDGFRITMLSFLLMASAIALRKFPHFNASLSPEADALILKRYYNIGVAVDTPDGLVVPVIKDADRKRIFELSQELSDVSQRMREGKIAPADIQGATFSISSLGGIGGTNFTPIVSAPEVAILGVVRAKMRPVWDGEEFVPRLMLPLCLSYDHRVIDGADAARFTRYLAEILGDIRKLIL